MKFSPTFYKAIDAISEYERVLKQDAKDNPLRLGSFVAAYDTYARPDFIGYGQVVGMEWHDGPDAYKYEIQVCQNAARIEVWSFHLRPVDADEIRLLFTALRHPCDR